MDTHDWKIALKNSAYLWGFLVLFILFDLFIDLWDLHQQNWLLAASLVMLMLSFAVAARAVRKMNTADKFRELTKILPDKK